MLDVDFVARAVPAVVIFLAGISKAFAVRVFAASVAAYNIVPRQLVRPTAVSVIALEVSSGMLLLGSIMVVEASLVAALLLGLFAVAMVTGLIRRRNLDCGCGGGRGHKVSWWGVVRNVTLAGMLLLPLVDLNVALKAMFVGLLLSLFAASVWLDARLNAVRPVTTQAEPGSA